MWVDKDDHANMDNPPDTPSCTELLHTVHDGPVTAPQPRTINPTFPPKGQSALPTSEEAKRQSTLVWPTPVQHIGRSPHTAKPRPKPENGRTGPPPPLKLPREREENSCTNSPRGEDRETETTADAAEATPARREPVALMRTPTEADEPPESSKHGHWNLLAGHQSIQSARPRLLNPQTLQTSWWRLRRTHGLGSAH